ncbi:MAG: glycosyltransferase [Blastocatellia bacterium]
MNLAFCLWLWKRAVLHRDALELMVHEPYLPFREGSIRQNLVAVVHRLMTIVLLNAARRVWISVPAWESRLRPYALARRLEFKWLPVPSTIPRIEDGDGVSAIRSRYVGAEGVLLAHFGPYIRQISDVMFLLLPTLLRHHCNLSVLLLGKGSASLYERLVREHSDLAMRIHAPGPLPADELSRHLSACDVMIQPYPDGVSSRRTSVMAGLSHGLAIVTTTGPQTESLWAESGAVLLAAAGDVASMRRLTEEVTADERQRKHLTGAARLLYKECFDLSATIVALRGVQNGTDRQLSRV